MEKDMTPSTTEQETGELKQTYYDDVPIRTAADAERFCDCPPYDKLKCSSCGHMAPYRRDVPYEPQAQCGNCGEQMMGTEWAGWYNHWRDLARELLNSHAELERERDALREALASAVIPYEALLLDSESRRWIAPEVWSAMETAVTKARAALGETK
jgi:hypothetical protein